MAGNRFRFIQGDKMTNENNEEMKNRFPNEETNDVENVTEKIELFDIEQDGAETGAKPDETEAGEAKDGAGVGEAKSGSEGSETPDGETGEDPEDLMSPEELKLAKRKELIGDIVFFVISFVVIFTLFKIFPPYRVSGDSMNMTLKNNAFGFGAIWFSPDYGDIIVLHGEKGKTNNDDFIKRIVGKPGDVLDITDGVVVRNGKELEEKYAYYDPGYLNKTGITQHFELKEDEYLVLGDNRYHSMDGRYFGTIKRSEMKCKMLFFLWGKKR